MNSFEFPQIWEIHVVCISQPANLNEFINRKG